MVFSPVIGTNLIHTSGSNKHSWKESISPKNFMTKVRKYAPKFSFAHAKASFFSPSINLIPQKYGSIKKAKKCGNTNAWLYRSEKDALIFFFLI